MTETLHIKLFPNAKIVMLDLAAAFLWAYGFLKLFVFDVDRWALEKFFPDAVWLVNIRVILAIALLALVATLLRKRGLAFIVFYILAFPFVVLFWKLPLVLIKLGGWVPRLVAINALLSLGTDIRYRLIYFVFASVGFVLIVVVGGYWPSIAGLVMMAVSIGTSFVKAFVDAFRAPRVLKLYRWLFDLIAKGAAKPEPAEQKLDVPVSGLPAEQQSKFLTTLQNRVFLNRGCIFFAERLKEYNKSNIHVVGAILSAGWLAVLLVLEFSLMYRAVGQIDPSAFSQSSMSTFDYVYTAFDNAIFGLNSSVGLASNLSRLVSMYERILGLALVVVFFAIVIEIRNKRHTIELEEAIQAGEKAGADMELRIADSFSYTNIDEALADLSRIESSLYVLFLKLSGSIRIR